MALFAHILQKPILWDLFRKYLMEKPEVGGGSRIRKREKPRDRKLQTDVSWHLWASPGFLHVSTCSRKRRQGAKARSEYKATLGSSADLGVQRLADPLEVKTICRLTPAPSFTSHIWACGDIGRILREHPNNFLPCSPCFSVLFCFFFFFFFFFLVTPPAYEVPSLGG